MLKQDKLTPKQRIKALLLNEPIDRVPFMPFMVSYMAIENNINLSDFFINPEIAFRAGLMTMRNHPWVNIRPVYGWSDHGAWEFGGKIEWPKNNLTMTPYTPEPLLSDPSQVLQLEVPDPVKTQWFQLRESFNELCFRNGLSVHLPSGSITSQLGSILGIANLMKWIKKYPQALHDLSQKVLNFNLQIAEKTIEKYGPGRCSVMTDLTLESNDLISEQLFEEFCFPYILKLHRFYYEIGIKSILIHLCGDHKGNLKYWKKIPLPKRTIFSVSRSMDLEAVSEFLGPDPILAGNMSTTLLQIGNPTEIENEVKRCLKQALHRPGGFILMPECEYPPQAPPRNLEIIRETLGREGFY